MKKSLSFFIGAIAALMLVTSCNDVAGLGSVLKGVNAVPKDETGNELTFGISAMMQSKTIFPDDWTEARSGSLYYVLTGSTDSENTYNGANEVPTENQVNEFSYASIKAGTAKISLQPAVWYLTLTAYTEATHDNIALIGQSTVDLRAGKAETTFALKIPLTATNAKGSTEITVEFIKPENFAKVVYGIYTDSLGQTPIDSSFSLNNAEFTSKMTAEPGNNVTAISLIDDSAKKYKIIYTNDSIKAGDIYHFVARFTDDEDKTVCLFDEPLVIDGGNLSSKTISLKKDAFNTKPNNPTSLTYKYKYATVEFDAATNNFAPVAQALDADTAVETTYDVEFTWDDNSNNEYGFEIIITDVTDPENPVEKIYAPADDPFIKQIDEEDRPTTYTPKVGTLMASTTKATIELETGKVYTAKIRAINYFNRKTDDETLAADRELNLYTVTYNLENGNIKTTAAASTGSSVVKYVVPYTKSSTVQNLIGATGSYPNVVREFYNFIKWYATGDADKTAITEIAADNTDNIDLTAFWESILTLKVTFPSYQAAEDNAITDIDNTYTISGIPVSPATDVKVEITTVANASVDTWKLYSYDGSVIYDGSTSTDGITSNENSFTWLITDQTEGNTPVSVTAGTYRLSVSGKYKAAGTGDEVRIGNSFYICITR
ncbi:MAG: hypothetical protein MJ188_01460 [Treponema sp.]|nr:hypothetical protein [Treponema sp.]